MSASTSPSDSPRRRGREPAVAALRGAAERGSILLTTKTPRPALGEEGYELRVGRARLTIAAHRPEGVFRGVQTLRQLLPAGRGGSVSVPAGQGARPAALRVARRHARRGAALLRRRGREAADRPGRELQAQPAASPPDRRPGLEAGDRIVAEARAVRRPHRRRRRPRRLLHAGAVRRDRPLRAEPVRRRRARDRHARPHERRARGLPRAQLRRSSARALYGDRRRLQHALHRQAGNRSLRRQTSSASWRR